MLALCSVARDVCVCVYTMVVLQSIVCLLNCNLYFVAYSLLVNIAVVTHQRAALLGNFLLCALCVNDIKL